MRVEERIGPVWCNRKEQAVLVLAALGLIATLAATRWTGWDRRHTVGLVGSGLLMGGALVAAALRIRTWWIIRETLERPTHPQAVTIQAFHAAVRDHCAPWIREASENRHALRGDITVPHIFWTDSDRQLGKIRFGDRYVVMGNFNSDQQHAATVLELHAALVDWLNAGPDWATPTELGLSQITFGLLGLPKMRLIPYGADPAEDAVSSFRDLGLREITLERVLEGDTLSAIALFARQRCQLHQGPANRQGGPLLPPIWLSLHTIIRQEGAHFRLTEPLLQVRDDDQRLIWSYRPPVEGNG